MPDDWWERLIEENHRDIDRHREALGLPPYDWEKQTERLMERRARKAQGFRLRGFAAWLRSHPYP